MTTSSSVSDFQPNSVLIFENRPSNLPAKSQQEALKHRQEYERMVEAAKRKEQREKEIRVKKQEQQVGFGFEVFVFMNVHMKLDSVLKTDCILLKYKIE